MNKNFKFLIFVNIFTLLGFISTASICNAATENWQLLGSDRGGMLIMEIDPQSIKTSVKKSSVKVKSTYRNKNRTAFGCSEGELRHWTLDRIIPKLVCGKSSSANPNGDHVEDWRLIRKDKIPNGVQLYELDINSIVRDKDLTWIHNRTSEITKETYHFDCKGYYKSEGGEWINIDILENPLTVPSGYVSLERKLEQKLCSNR
jgi:hypothetical protein